MDIKKLLGAVGACVATTGFTALPDKPYIIDYWTPPVDMAPGSVWCIAFLGEKMI